MSETVADFLMARISEDEAEAERQSGLGWWPNLWRAQDECKAKRRIVGDAMRWDADRIAESTPQPTANALADVLRHMALVYADHPDFRDEWR